MDKRSRLPRAFRVNHAEPIYVSTMALYYYLKQNKLKTELAFCKSSNHTSLVYRFCACIARRYNLKKDPASQRMVHCLKQQCPRHRPYYRDCI